jgi:hypothetical protein
MKMEKSTDKTLYIYNNCMVGPNKSGNHVNMFIDEVN